MCIAAARYLVVDLGVDSLEEDIEAGFGNCIVVDCFACCMLVVVARLCCLLDRSKSRLLRRGRFDCMPYLYSKMIQSSINTFDVMMRSCRDNN